MRRLILPCVLGLLALTTVACGGSRSDTEALMISWAQALKFHITTDHQGNYEFPDRLEEINPTLRTGLVTSDAWGNELYYRKLQDDRYDLISAGPDGELGNDDDIVITNGKVKKPADVYGERPIRR